MLDWSGGVFHPTFTNFRWFRTFARSNCNSNFLMCFRILNFVSIKNIYRGWGRHNTMYYSCNTRPCIINKVSKNISIPNLQLLCWIDCAHFLEFEADRMNLWQHYHAIPLLILHHLQGEYLLNYLDDKLGFW